MSSVYPVADAMALAKFAAVPISGTRHGRDTRRNALADQELTASHLLRNLFASITPRIAPDRAKPSKSLAKPLPRQKISNGTPDFSFVAPNCAPRSGRGKFTSDFGAKGAAKSCRFGRATTPVCAGNAAARRDLSALRLSGEPRSSRRSPSFVPMASGNTIGGWRTWGRLSRGLAAMTTSKLERYSLCPSQHTAFPRLTNGALSAMTVVWKARRAIQ
jgi:hypothetical protein